MSTTFKSVRDFIEANSSEERLSAFDENQRCTGVVRELTQCRIRAGLTQKLLADLMGVTQSAVSKIENSCDLDISLGQMVNYSLACKIPFTLRVGAPVSLVQSIKDHALSIKADLNKLADLACENEDDSDIPSEIAEFFDEAGFNLMAFLVDAAEKLPESVLAAKTPMLRILTDNRISQRTKVIAHKPSKREAVC